MKHPTKPCPRCEGRGFNYGPVIVVNGEPNGYEHLPCDCKDGEVEIRISTCRCIMGGSYNGFAILGANPSRTLYGGSAPTRAEAREKLVAKLKELGEIE